MSDQRAERAIVGEALVPASIEAVWEAWTTERGAETFFAPKCNIDLRPGGAYEMLFDLEAEPGDRGGEGMIVLAVQPAKMLSFTWNAPPDMPSVRGQMTHVSVRFEGLEPGRTRVTLRHDGWGEGEEWDAAYAYFQRAWNEVVLPRLTRRFAEGPVDWDARRPEDQG